MVLISGSIAKILTLFYLILMGYYRWGWNKIKQPNNSESTLPNTPVSIIIPTRNEEKNIIQCLTAIYKQTYSKKNVEVIVVDDYSTDTTTQVVNSFKEKKEWTQLQLLELRDTSNERYKKAAITAGIKQAKGELILTTDADCTMGHEWLTEVVKFFKQTNAVLVSGAVVFDWDKKKQNILSHFFLQIQQLEFAGLVGIGGAALQLKFPNMCNGANMAYKKEVFDEVGGYIGNDNLLSGDDEFLMHKVFSKYPKQVHFLKNKKTIVKTPPAFTFKAFMAQRMRWVSKSTKYSDKRITAVLAMAYLFNLSIVVNGFLGFINPLIWWVAIGQLVFKIFVEYWFYATVLKYFNLKHLLKYIIAAQPFHILYVLIIGILGNFGSYSWKGRTQ